MNAEEMPKRTTIRIPDTLVAEIERWARARGQGFATICALAVEKGVQQAREAGEIPPEESPAKSLKKEAS
jgi:hypothetical protein